MLLAPKEVVTDFLLGPFIPAPCAPFTLARDVKISLVVRRWEWQQWSVVKASQEPPTPGVLACPLSPPGASLFLRGDELQGKKCERVWRWSLRMERAIATPPLPATELGECYRKRQCPCSESLVPKAAEFGVQQPTSSISSPGLSLEQTGLGWEALSPRINCIKINPIWNVRLILGNDVSNRCKRFLY